MLDLAEDDYTQEMIEHQEALREEKRKK